MSFIERVKSKLRRDAQSKKQSNPSLLSPSGSTPPNASLAPELEETPRILPEVDLETQDASTSSNAAIPSKTFQSTISAVWSEAWNELFSDPQTASLAKRYESLLLDSAAGSVRSGEVLPYGKHEQLRFLIERQAEEIEKNEWKLRFQGYDFKVKALIEPAIAVTQSAKGFIGSAVEASPPASLAWAGVCLLLPLVLNPCEGEEARVKGLEYLSSVLRQCKLREYVYQRRYESVTGEAMQRDFDKAHLIYRESLRTLYVKTLVFEVNCFVFLAGDTSKRLAKGVAKWDDWNTLIDAVKSQQAVVTQIEDNWRDVRMQEEWEAKQQEHRERVAAFDSVSSELSRMKDLIQQQRSQQDRSDLLRWLSSVADPSTNYAAARDKHTQNTGEWILKEEEFRNWMVEDNSLLWLHGKAGSGKSFLSTTVINYLQSHCSTGVDQIYSAVAYFYFDFRNPSKQTRNNLLRCLVAQVCQGRPDTPEALLQLSKFRDLGQSPPTEELQKALLSSVQDFSNVYIVLDALDECPQAGSERDLLMQCIQEIRGKEVSQLHMLVTSRHEHDIASYLVPRGDPDDKYRVSGCTSQLGLDTYPSKMKGDIEAYIHAQLSSARFRHWKPDLKRQVHRALVEKSQGMFQYVAIQLEVLHGTRMSMVDAALEALPQDLNQVYKRALQQSPDPAITIRALKLLAYFEVEMKMDLLALFARLKPVFHHRVAGGTVDIKSLFDDDLDIAAPEDILRWLPSLVAVYRSIRFGPQLVRICHFSLLEFLTSPQADESWRIEPTEARLDIVQSSLAYYIYTIDCMLQPGTGTLMIFERNDLRNIFKLLESVPKEGYSETLCGLIRKLFNPHAQYFTRLPGLLGPYVGVLHCLKSRGPEMPLQLLYRRGFKSLIPAIIRIMPEVVNMVEEESIGHSALIMASYNIDHNMVKILLEAGADPFACSRRCLPAFRACFLGMAERYCTRQESLISCVKLLLDAGGTEVVKHSRTESDHTGPLSWLFRLAWDPELTPHLAEILFEHGADVAEAFPSAVKQTGAGRALWLMDHGAKITSLTMQAAKYYFLEHLVRDYYSDEDTYKLTHIEVPPASFDCLHFLFSRGGAIPPDTEEPPASHRYDLSNGFKDEPWDDAKQRLFRIVFEAKSRDGTYVKSPAEANEDLERWKETIPWLLSNMTSKWPPDVPLPSVKDMEFFEEWWELKRKKLTLRHDGDPWIKSM